LRVARIIRSRIDLHRTTEIMPHSTVQIKTQDGTCPTHIFTPAGGGPWPGAMLFMDGIGIRPALFEMGDRLASAGYYVAMPDLYYRLGPTSYDAKRAFTDPVQREDLMTRALPSASIANVMRDSNAFFAHLEQSPNVRGTTFGITGYCLGGRLALSAAGTFPERVAAAASYHGSGLATDAPESPHLLAPRMKARVYVAGAIEDKSFDDEQKARLDDALAEAHVPHTVETYNARHGWVPSDTPVHDPVEAEHHWRTLLDLFANTLS
jgi:carboxymethylenebutenolidase